MKDIKLLTLFIFASLLLCLLLLSSAFAQIPHLINYQGKLTDTNGNPVADGNYSITFRIYDAAGGGTLLWEETQSILVQKGLFSCLLGGVTNLDLAFDKPYWLAIKVGSDAEMTPRQQIASVGYAIRAEKVNEIRGSENILRGSGNVGFGTLDPRAQLEIAGEGTLRLNPRSTLPANPQEGTIFYSTTDKKLYFYEGSRWRVLATAALSISYPDEKRYTCSGGSGPCNLGTRIHFTWSNLDVPAIMNRLRVNYEWSSGNFAHDYYSHNIQVLVNGNVVESLITHQTGWVTRDNTYDVGQHLQYGGNDTVRIQLTDTSGNEEDWYQFRNVYFEFQ